MTLRKIAEHLSVVFHLDMSFDDIQLMQSEGDRVIVSRVGNDHGGLLGDKLVINHIT
jgi:hypothetical protein